VTASAASTDRNKVHATSRKNEIIMPRLRKTLPILAAAAATAIGSVSAYAQFSTRAPQAELVSSRATVFSPFTNTRLSVSQAVAEPVRPVSADRSFAANSASSSPRPGGDADRVDLGTPGTDRGFNPVVNDAAPGFSRPPLSPFRRPPLGPFRP
jgi:hypothetical protein